MTVNYMASLLNLLPKYLSDLLKHETDKKVTTHIHVKIYSKGVFAHIDKKVKIIDNKIVAFCPFDRVTPNTKVGTFAVGIEPIKNLVLGFQLTRNYQQKTRRKSESERWIFSDGSIREVEQIDTSAAPLMALITLNYRFELLSWGKLKRVLKD